MIMNASSVRIFRCAGARWTAECPWKCSLWPWPAPTSGPLVARAAPAREVDDRADQCQHHQDADDATDAVVAAEDAAVRPLVAGEAVVLGDLGQPVRAGVGEAADDPGEQQGDGQDAEDDPPRGDPL